MSYLQRQMETLKYDKRLLEINLKNGSITREEYDNFITQLADSSANAEKLQLEKEVETPEANSAMQAPANNFPTNTDPFGSGY